jgi:hypothetical protein
MQLTECIYASSSRRKTDSSFDNIASNIITVAFSADGKKLLGGTRAGEAYLWNLGTGQMLGSGHALKSSKENVPTPFNSLVLAPNGEFVVTLEEEFHSSTLARTRTPRRFWAPDCAFGGAAVSPNGSHISAMSSEERLLVLDVENLGQAAGFGPGGRRSVWHNVFQSGRREDCLCRTRLANG